jgi:HlyD family secretion protein
MNNGASSNSQPLNNLSEIMHPGNGTQINGTQQRKIRLLVVDDQKTVREGLRLLLEQDSAFEVVGTADSGQTAIEQVAALRPDVVLIDMEMPQLDGVRATEAICQRFPGTKVLVLSSHDSNRYVAQSLDAGAKGYLLKGTPAQELQEAIWSVYRGYVHIGPGLFDKITELVVQPHRETLGTLAASSTLANDKAKSVLAVSPKSEALSPKFEQAVILRQPLVWSRSIVWTIIGVTVAGLVWAALATIEQVVPATGQLKPQGTVKKIQAPVNGVVKEVFVEDGDHVKQGQLLVLLDSTASQAQLKSLEEIRRSLRQENEFYQTLMAQSPNPVQVEAALVRLQLPKEVEALARNRLALLQENQLFQMQLGAVSDSTKLPSDQRARLQATRTEVASRAAASKLDKGQLEQQLQQAQVQLADAKRQLIADRQVLAEIQSRNDNAIAQASESLAIEEKILKTVQPLLEEGALAKLQVERQKQSIADRYQGLIEKRSNGAIEYEKQQQQIKTRLADIGKFSKEVQRLQLAIAQAQEKYTNTVSLSERDIRDKIADNQKRIAEIDSQFTKNIVENQKRIAEIDSQISQAKVTLKYQELRSPVNGTVFDLKAAPGFVPQPSQAEPLLNVVPDDYLIAEVDVTNRDIGFVRASMNADVRIDSFPFSEFGDIKGKVTSIGSDALPPDETHRYYRFPTKIALDSQVLKVNDREIPLQSGMSVSVNIKVRESRTVMSLFTELFSKKMESLKQVR